MQAILKYELPEEVEEYETAVAASRYKLCLYELDQFLRSNIKYAPDAQSDMVTDTYQAVRDKLYQLAHEASIDI